MTTATTNKYYIPDSEFDVNSADIVLATVVVVDIVAEGWLMG